MNLQLELAHVELVIEVLEHRVRKAAKNLEMEENATCGEKRFYCVHVLRVNLLEYALMPLLISSWI